jgi:hypothetical protein
MDNAIVHIDVEVPASDLFFEVIVYHGLKSRGGIGKAKEHYCRFEESFTSLEGSLPLIALLDPDVIVAPMDVELGVPLLPR